MIALFFFQIFSMETGLGAQFYWQTNIGNRHYQSDGFGDTKHFKLRGRQTSFSLHTNFIRQDYALAGMGYTFIDQKPKDWSANAHKVQLRTPFMELLLQPIAIGVYMRLRWSKFGYTFYSYQNHPEAIQASEPEKTSTETREMSLGYRHQLVPIASLLFEISRGIEYTIHETSELSGRINVIGLYIGLNVRIKGTESTSL